MNLLLIKDQNDQSGFGMFSKAGRFTTEKYSSALKQFNMVFKSEQKKKHQQSNEDDSSQKDEDEQLSLKDENISVTQSAHHKINQINKSQQPFSKSLSREKAYHTEKDPPPPAGYYTPKYSHIFRKPKLILSFTSSQKKQNQDIKILHEVPTRYSDKPKNLHSKIKGYYNLNKMIPRDQHQRAQSEQNANPIDYQQAFRASSNHKHKRAITLEKQVPRNYRPSTSPCFNFCYDKKFNQVERRITIDGPDFNRYKPRIQNINTFNSINQDNYFEYDQWSLNTSKVYPKLFKQSTKKSVINYSSMLSREKDKNGKYPGHMQKNINSRMILQVLHQKMLEQNNFDYKK